MQVLIVGGIAEHLGKTSEVKRIEFCEGIGDGALYQLKACPTELGLALFYSRDQLVFLDGPVLAPSKVSQRV